MYVRLRVYELCIWLCSSVYPSSSLCVCLCVWSGVWVVGTPGYDPAPVVDAAVDAATDADRRRTNLLVENMPNISSAEWGGKRSNVTGWDSYFHSDDYSCAPAGTARLSTARLAEALGPGGGPRRAGGCVSRRDVTRSS